MNRLIRKEPDDLGGRGGSSALLSGGRLMRTSFLATILLLSFQTAIARGPDIPCADCSEVSTFFLPESGIWYNPQEPGTGISLEIQNDIVMGAYYAFTEEGSPVWYTFAGTLQKASPVSSFAGDLTRFFGGSCITCEYQPPHVDSNSDTITIEFVQRNNMLVSVNQGEAISMVPSVAGVLAQSDFVEQTNYRIPDLEGTWVLVFDNPDVIGEWGRSSVVAEFGPRQTFRNDLGELLRVKYVIDTYPSIPEIANLGNVQCDVPHDETGASPFCRMRIITRYPGIPSQVRLEFPLPYANIGDSRIQSINGESGIRVDVIRLDYD